MYAALAAKSEFRLTPLEIQDIAHREHSTFTNQPIRRCQRALSKYTAISCEVRERKLFVSSVKDQLVRSRDRSRAHTRRGDRSLESFPRCLGDGNGGTRRRVLFLRMVCLQDVHVEFVERPHQRSGVASELYQHVHPQREVG